MPTALGASNPRIAATRALLAKEGRAAARRFAFEGETLLAEAERSGATVREIFATPERYGSSEAVRAWERRGTPVYLIEQRTLRKISDVETPSGVVAVSDIPQFSTADLLDAPLVLLLADLGDPANAGTLLRTAEAFGVDAVLFGDRGVDPYLPKVVRGGMGAHFRLRIAFAAPADLEGREAHVIGLEGGGEPLTAAPWPIPTVLAVGNERHGLGRFRAVCGGFRQVPMRGRAESLNAAVAGAIGLYEASKPLNAQKERL